MVSQAVFIRRIIGRKGVFLLRNILSSLAYYTGLYEHPESTGRPMGISALMCTHDEEDWIEPAILSVKNLVDEYVVVDSSSDRTPEIITGVAKEHGLNVKLLRIPPGDLVKARLVALENSSFRWLMPFDADMILYEKGVKMIRQLIESLNPHRHYLIYWRYLLLCGDLMHVCSEQPYHIEHWMFTYSRKLTYKYLDFGNGVYMDALIAPLSLYKPLIIDDVLGVHLTRVRSPEKLALKHVRLEHRKLLLEYVGSGFSFEEAATRIARDIYGAKDLQQLGLRLIEQLVKEMPVYDEQKYGPLPRVLLEYVSRKGL